jgi:hypothetical protein
LQLCRAFQPALAKLIEQTNRFDEPKSDIRSSKTIPNRTCGRHIKINANDWKRTLDRLDVFLKGSTLYINGATDRCADETSLQ